MAWPRALLSVLPLLAACAGEPDNTTTSATSSGTTAISSTGGSTGSSSTGEPTTSEPTTDGCASHPPGDWVACRQGGLTDTGMCGFEAGQSAGEVACLVPSGGGFNVCGIRECVDDCDCFTAPTTGTAIPSCEKVGSKNACVLYCLNGQQCPDGMECVSAYCYWPD